MCECVITNYLHMDEREAVSYSNLMKTATKHTFFITIYRCYFVVE